MPRAVTAWGYWASERAGPGASEASDTEGRDTRAEPTAAANGAQDGRREQRAATDEGAGGPGEERTPDACRPWMADPRSKRRATDGARAA